MRNRLNAPIVYDRFTGGYHFAVAQSNSASHYELPGLWFNATEIHALLTMQHLLEEIDGGGILEPHIAPLRARLEGLLGAGKDAQEAVRQRVRIIQTAARKSQNKHFPLIGSALVARQRLLIRYGARSTGEVTEREISPLRLVHYRENWYLDAWCHVRDAIRSFSLDAIESAQLTTLSAKEVDVTTLAAELDSGYGIFAGPSVQWAKLRFSPERTRWVASEVWHPQQHSDVDEQGRYLLEIPYADHRELLMDILKHGANVEVLAPDSLRQLVRNEITCMVRHYA